MTERRQILDRPLKLAGTVALTMAAVALVDGLADTAALGWLRDLINKSDVFGPLFFPDSGTIEWKDRLQGIVLLLGLPVAFLLWYWRDRNVRDQIEEQRRQVENARKDTNLKEFQDVKLHAAGIFDESVPAKAQEQLQIAALHQLRPFLRGDYSEDFKRPAFELLLAGHAAAMDEIGTRAACAEFEKFGDTDRSAAIPEIIESLKSKLTPLMKERIRIIRDEADAIFNSGFPLHDRNFDLLEFEIKMNTPLNLSRSSCIGTSIEKSHIPKVIFYNSNLIGTKLTYCNLSSANFRFCSLTGAEIDAAVIQGSDFDISNWWEVSKFDAARYDGNTPNVSSTKGDQGSLWDKFKEHGAINMDQVKK